MVSIEEILLLTHMNARQIRRWINGNTVHFAETSDGLLVVCLNGFLKSNQPNCIDSE